AQEMSHCGINIRDEQTRDTGGLVLRCRRIEDAEFDGDAPRNCLLEGSCLVHQNIEASGDDAECGSILQGRQPKPDWVRLLEEVSAWEDPFDAECCTGGTV